VLAPGAMPRPRNKTFEEYSKDTEDIWDDRDEELTGLSGEIEHPGQVRGVQKAERKPRNSPKGKGKC